MKTNDLTSRQQEILDFLIQHTKQFSFPPTIPELMKQFGFKSPNAASDHLKALERKGFITRHFSKSRGIEIAGLNAVKENQDNIQIPIVGRIAAGAPIFAEQNIEGSLPVSKDFISRPDEVFALRVKGESMINAGILDGDFIIVEKQPVLNQGEIGVVLLDDEATVKRVYTDNEQIKLVPENETMKPIIVKKGEKNVTIIGKVKMVIRKL